MKVEIGTKQKTWLNSYNFFYNYAAERGVQSNDLITEKLQMKCYINAIVDCVTSYRS